VDRSGFPDLDRFSRSVGIPKERLVEAFEIERRFHEAVLAEPSAERRKALYEEVYAAVHRLYGKTEVDLRTAPNPQASLVRLFRKELAGRSILEVGCGVGFFLAGVARQLAHGPLVGLDVSIPEASRRHPELELVEADVIRFDLGRRFDVVFSNQLLEHIAPADLAAHLRSVRAALVDAGTLIVLAPNRLFGPSDVTRIVDFSQTGRVPAQGTHLNETTHEELLPALAEHGFRDFRTVLPVPGLRDLVPGLRLRPGWLTRVERSPAALGLLRRIRVRGQCVARFGVTLIATAGPGQEPAG
jgi:SAM-dependent methyltransferase